MEPARLQQSAPQPVEHQRPQNPKPQHRQPKPRAAKPQQQQRAPRRSDAQQLPAFLMRPINLPKAPDKKPRAPRKEKPDDGPAS